MRYDDGRGWAVVMMEAKYITNIVLVTQYAMNLQNVIRIADAAFDGYEKDIVKVECHIFCFVTFCRPHAIFNLPLSSDGSFISYVNDLMGGII